MKNAINWFEIPVKDIERAEKFYTEIFDKPMSNINFGPVKMRMFAFEGVTGSLVEVENHKPANGGIKIYFDCSPDLQVVLDRVEKAGGKIILAKSIISVEIGYHATIEDTEGNQVSLHSIN